MTNQDFSIRKIEDSALEKAEKLAKSNNKPVYMCVVQDPFDTTKNLYFLSQKIDKSTNYVDITGVYITHNQYKKIKQIDDALSLLEAPQVNDCFPWSKIRVIMNVGFKLKQLKE